MMSAGCSSIPVTPRDCSSSKNLNSRFVFRDLTAAIVLERASGDLSSIAQEFILIQEDKASAILRWPWRSLVFA
jgi:hypothetical protein